MKPTLVLVSGPWSSGTTAVAGALVHAGLKSFGPFLQTRDPRTPNSYEWTVFRDWTQRFASEQTLSLTVDSPAPIRAAALQFRDEILDQRYGPYDPLVDAPLVMKYPLSALLLPALADAFSLRVLVVTRPLADIEATARRRGWGQVFGATGAQLIYSQLFDALVHFGWPAELLHFPRLLADPREEFERALRFCNHQPSPEQLRAAIEFIRPDQADHSAR